MTYLTIHTLHFDYAASSVGRESIWTRLARAYSLWRKQARDRADLAAMGYRDLQDIGFPTTECRFPQTCKGL